MQRQFIITMEWGALKARACLVWTLTLPHLEADLTWQLALQM